MFPFWSYFASCCLFVHLPVLCPQTTILAATFNGGVVIGSDSRASMGG